MYQKGLLKPGAVIPRPAMARAVRKESVSRIAVVSHNCETCDEFGLWDYSHSMGAIHRTADAAGCDTVVYAPWSWDRASKVSRTKETLFGRTRRVEHVIMEVADLQEKRNRCVFEIWNRRDKTPARFVQLFGYGAEASRRGAEIIEKVSERQFCDAWVIACGETNIIRVSHTTGRTSDPFRLAAVLCEQGIRVILNPVHTRIQRWEMPLKRRHLSKDGRALVSVWNMRSDGGRCPWAVYYDGRDCSAGVVELDNPVASRSDLRIGIVDLKALRSGRI